MNTFTITNACRLKKDKCYDLGTKGKGENEVMNNIKNGKENLYLQIACAFAYISMVAVNILSETLPINGVTSANVSDLYPTLFTPAGITFSIWGVIYILLGIFIVLQFLKKNKEISLDIGVLFIISSALNICWLIAWHYQMLILSLAIIVGLLITLLKISWRLDRAPNLIRAPFSIYFGWITVASIANLMVLLLAKFENFWGSTFEVIITVIALVVAGMIGAWRIKYKNDILYGLTIVWSIIGIVINHISFYNASYTSIFTACFFSLALLIFTMVMNISNSKNRFQLKSKTL